MTSQRVRLVSGKSDVWKEIGKLSGKPRLAAIAYLGDNASHLLGDFARGDIVVCDASDGSIRSGSTSRKALNDLVKRGVHVFSLQDLHAKVICIGRTAVVGSMNASASSTSMHEAAAILTNDQDVRAARQLVRRFVSQTIAVDDRFLRRVGRMKVQRRQHSAGTLGRDVSRDDYVTIGVVHKADHAKYVRDALAKKDADHVTMAGYEIKVSEGGRGERRDLNIGELVVWVYADEGENPRLEIGRIIDYEKIRDRWLYFDLTPTKAGSVRLNQLKKCLATMRYTGNLDEIGNERRRIRLSGIQEEISRLFGKSTPPVS